MFKWIHLGCVHLFNYDHEVEKLLPHNPTFKSCTIRRVCLPIKMFWTVNPAWFQRYNRRSWPLKHGCYLKNERRQQGMPFETLYMLKYAFLGEIFFWDLERSFCHMSEDVLAKFFIKIVWTIFFTELVENRRISILFVKQSFTFQIYQYIHD